VVVCGVVGVHRTRRQFNSATCGLQLFYTI